MITLEKVGDALKFTFSGNSLYLQDGTIEVPLNSLTLVTDESGIATFKKSATNDIFVCASYDELGMTKSELESWFKENAVGVGGTDTGTVQTMIDESISGKADSSSVYTKSETSGATEIATALSGKADTSSVVTAVTSASTDNEIPTAKAVYDAIPTGGTGGGKAISGGTNISVTTGETADTVSCTIPAYRSGSSNGISLNYDSNTASGTRSLAAGSNCKATYENSVAMGYNSEAKNNNTFAMGQYAISSGFCSAAICREAQAKNMAEFACGNFNISNKANTTFGDSGNTLFSVGNGTADNARHNAFEIRQNGDIYITSGGTDILLQDNLGGGSITTTSAVTSGSTDAVTSGGVYSQMGGLKLQQITQADYDALVQGGTVDASTLYIITNVVN